MSGLALECMCERRGCLVEVEAREVEVDVIALVSS